MKKPKRRDCESCKDALDFIQKLEKKTPKRVGYLHNEHNDDYSKVQWFVTWSEPERAKSESD